MTDPVQAPSPAVAALLAAAVDRLTVAGSGSPRLDAELLLAQVLGTDRSGIRAHPDALVGDGPRDAFEALLARRERGEPVAYIRGFREFHGLVIATDARALIPRPETELLVDAALGVIGARLTAAPRPEGTPPLRVADVGTGSGAIAVALLVALRRRRMADQVLVDASDLSADALQLARENAVSHGVADRMAFAVADLLPERVEPPYAVICANLPYVATGDLAGLSKDLEFEPQPALDGGPGGLGVVRRLLDLLPGTLAADGVALLEIGADQGEAIAQEVVTRLRGWRCSVTADLAGLPRLARIEPPPADADAGGAGAGYAAGAAAGDAAGGAADHGPRA